MKKDFIKDFENGYTFLFLIKKYNIDIEKSDDIIIEILNSYKDISKAHYKNLIKRIKELNKKGLNDCQIANELCLTTLTIRKILKN